MSENPQKLLRRSEMHKLVPYSESYVYRLVREGLFPKPIKIGKRAVAWRPSDIADYLAKLNPQSTT